MLPIPYLGKREFGFSALEVSRSLTSVDHSCRQDQAYLTPHWESSPCCPGWPWTLGLKQSSPSTFWRAGTKDVRSEPVVSPFQSADTNLILISMEVLSWGFYQRLCKAGIVLLPWSFLTYFLSVWVPGISFAFCSKTRRGWGGSFDHSSIVIEPNERQSGNHRVCYVPETLVN